MPDILHTVMIKASSERVWQALTTKDGVSRWWTIGHTALEGDPGRSGVFTFTSRAVVISLEVAVLNRPVQVVWRVVEANAPGGWIGTTITFDLKAVGEATQLAFTHTGFAEDNEGYRRVTAGWAQYLQNLNRLAEADQDGLPINIGLTQ